MPPLSHVAIGHEERAGADQEGDVPLELLRAREHARGWPQLKAASAGPTTIATGWPNASSGS